MNPVRARFDTAPLRAAAVMAQNSRLGVRVLVPTRVPELALLAERIAEQAGVDVAVVPNLAVERSISRLAT